MKITILLGSVRTGRQSYKVAYYLEKMLQKRGVATDLIDLANDTLPIYGYPIAHPSVHERTAEAIGKRLREADALLLVTPEYHGSYSGVLKNALDYYWAEFRKKPMGVVTASSGKMGGINASVQLQHVVLSLGAFPVPVKLLVPEVQWAIDEFFEPLRDDVVIRTRRFLDEFLWFSQAIVQAKSVDKPAAA